MIHSFVNWGKSFTAAIRRELQHRQPVHPSTTNPYIRLEDGLLAILCALLFLLVRYLIIHLVKTRWFPHRSARLKRKLSENLFYTTYHSTSTLLFLYVMRSETWTINPFTNKTIVVDLVRPKFPPISSQMRFMYMYDLGFWMSALFFISFLDKRLSDFRELFFHHLATLSLILASYRFAYVRFGILLMVLHDIGDIFLYGAKFMHYVGIPYMDTILFVIFATTFYLSRLVVLPRLIYAAGVETLQITIDHPGFNQWGEYFDMYICHWLVLVSLLCFLQVLHCFWFSLVLKMIYRELFLGKKVSEGGDIRDSSDSEMEETEMEEKKLVKMLQVENGNKHVHYD